MTLNSKYFRFCLSDPGIISMCHHSGTYTFIVGQDTVKIWTEEPMGQCLLHEREDLSLLPNTAAKKPTWKLGDEVSYS